MNVFGIGGLELLVILLVAFVALGPGKTVEVARTIGRMARGGPSHLHRHNGRRVVVRHGHRNPAGSDGRESRR